MDSMLFEENRTQRRFWSLQGHHNVHRSHQQALLVRLQTMGHWLPDRTRRRRFRTADHDVTGTGTGFLIRGTRSLHRRIGKDSCRKAEDQQPTSQPVMKTRRRWVRDSRSGEKDQLSERFQPPPSFVMGNRPPLLFNLRMTWISKLFNADDEDVTRDRLQQPEREAIMDALHYMMFCDHIITRDEDKMLEAIKDQLAWDSVQSVDSYAKESTHRVRKALESTEEENRLLRDIRNRVTGEVARTRMRHMLDRMIDADHQISPREIEVFRILTDEAPSPR